MKLETILNAYGKAMSQQMDYMISVEIVDRFPFKNGLEPGRLKYYTKKRNDKQRQSEKFKARLMRVLKQHEGECSFSFTDAYYEDDLRHCCLECGGELQIVRPGKWQCPKCE